MLVCAGLALVGGIVSVNLWRELRAERALTAELRQQLGGTLSAGTQPSGAGDGTTSMAAAAAASATPAPPAAGTGEAAATPALERPPAPQNVASFILDQQEMMKDPEYRKARLAQMRMTLPQNYPGLIDALGLSPEEADKLYDLLAEQQLEMSDTTMLMATVNGVAPDPAVMEDANRRRMETQRRHEEALASTLGGRYPQWQEYQQTRGARQQVVQLGRTMEAAGLPLTPEQSRPLVDLYIAEQRRQREESTQIFATMRSGGAVDQARMMEESFRLQTESNRRVLEAARPHLSAQQLNALQASLEQQLAMNRVASRVARQRAESGQAQGGTVTFISAAPVAAVPITLSAPPPPPPAP